MQRDKRPQMPALNWSEIVMTLCWTVLESCMVDSDKYHIPCTESRLLGLGIFVYSVSSGLS